MKFEDALKRIKGAESVGGQLIVNRGGRNILVGHDIQGNLIVEDEAEAKSVAGEVDEKAFEDGQDAAEVSEDRSPLSTHPTKATIHATDPAPYMPGDAPPPQPGDPDADAEARRDAMEPPKGSDPNAPHANTTKPAEQGKHHEHHVDDKVETKDKTNNKK